MTAIVIENAPHIDTSAFECIANNAYHEARGEKIIGMIAVTQVVLNRANKGKMSVCEVVYKPYQFSWTANKLLKKVDVTSHAWRDAERVAYWATFGATCPASCEGIPGPFAKKSVNLESPFLLATHYHAADVTPAWSTRLKKLGVLGNHVFYRE